MDTHDKAHYGIAVLLAAALGYAGIALHGTASVSDVSPQYHLTASAIDASPLLGQNVVIFAASGASSAAYQIADAVKAAGGRPKVEMDSLAHEGIWISPDSPEGHAMADRLSKLIGEQVAVGNYPGGEAAYKTAYFIGVGIPKRK